jgi:hypothetical protein
MNYKRGDLVWVESGFDGFEAYVWCHSNGALIVDAGGGRRQAYRTDDIFVSLIERGSGV